MAAQKTRDHESRPSELLTTEGKLKLKEELVRSLRERPLELGIQEVHFTEQLIQR